MKIFFATLFVLSLNSAFAEVSKENVETMLDQMVKEEVISAKEAEKARIRLHSMNQKQWKSMNADANKVAARSPASVTEAPDLHSAQFKQIESDIKKIVPHDN